MKNIRISSFIFIMMIVFFTIDFIGYKVLSEHMTSDHEKNTKIFFYEIKNHTSSLLSGVLADYNIQKEPMKKKHKIVMDYMNTHDLDVDLDEIYQKINRGHKNKPYNIYITDKDLVIKNTTYKNDIGYDLNFAKNIFDKHKAENVIGCSTPIRERTSKNFLSYTDSYLSKNGDNKRAILQLSYAYQDTTQEFNALLEIIQKYPMVKEVMAYSINNSGHVYEMVINDLNVFEYKPSLQRHLKTKKKALLLEKKLKDLDLIKENFIKEDIPYSLLYMSANSKIDKNNKIIYSILIDESGFYDDLRNLDILLIIISLMTIISIFTITRLRSKEVRLSEQDKFVQSAMHEIKTPLSIITLNNELRQLEHGTDTYSEEIDNALKILHTSYSSMGFIMNKNKLSYVIKSISLNKILKERIHFFQSIATANDRKIISDINSNCSIDISFQELIRLIDNNLSNALKYSHVGSIIKVVLDEDTLSFHTKGKTIQDKEKIFHQYIRENTTVGGYGLGLSIIKDIADKFSIDVKVQSDADNGTIFTYIFKCHTDDIS